MSCEFFNLRLWADNRELEEWQAGDLALVDAVTAYRIQPPINRAELVAMPYRDYLSTDHWQTQRRRALYRAGFQCKACEKPRQLNVHHLTYAHRGREQESDLIVLCLQCHAKVHEMLERCPPDFVDDLLRDRPWWLAKQYQQYFPVPPDA
jgi:hypothetical protein